MLDTKAANRIRLSFMVTGKATNTLCLCNKRATHTHFLYSFRIVLPNEASDDACFLVMKAKARLT